jgi:ubiquinone/menaquinone biosynthesis C-methylase UbiE
MPIQKDPEGAEILHMEKAVTFTGRNVLELGCGDGRLTWKYALSAGRVTGVDPDGEALRSAIKSRQEDLEQSVSFVRASSLALPFPHEEFDLAILAWTL